MKKVGIVLAALLVLAGLVSTAPAVDATSGRDLPSEIDLPSGFFPEGIAAGRGSTFYVSSLADGSIWRGDFRRGAVEPLTEPAGPFSAIGLAVDRRGRVWAAGGPSGAARVYDGRSGELLATYQLTAPFESFVNDVVVAGNRAWFTDSGTQDDPDPAQFRFLGEPRVFGIPVNGPVPEPDRVVELELDIPDVGFPNLNGIESTPDGRRLLVAHSTLSAIFNVNPNNGAAFEIEVDQPFPGADGLLRDGRRLYIANTGNEITELLLSRLGTSARFRRTLVAEGAETTTTIAMFGGGLYLPDARFLTQSDPYRIYRVPLS
ncbi:MAG: superoxide dismutase [Actinomycetota bacterium]